MSVQTQIDRINAAKADILAALTEKGVDTSGAGLADIAALVAGIEAGGGGGNFATGTFTVTSDVNYRNITHDLGTIPNLFIVWSNDVTAGSSLYIITLASFVPDPTDTQKQAAVIKFYSSGSETVNVTTQYSSGISITGSASSSTDYAKTPYVANVNENECRVHGYYGSASSSQRKFKSGATYKWIVGKV